MAKHASFLALGLLVLLVAIPSAHGLAKIKLRKGVVDSRIRKIHHANKSNLISQQILGDGEKVDIINFMDAQVRTKNLRNAVSVLFSFSTKSLESHPLHLLFILSPFFYAVLWRGWTRHPSSKIHGCFRHRFFKPLDSIFQMFLFQHCMLPPQ